MPEALDTQITLPTVLPVDDSGAVVFPGDLVAQYRYCLEKTGRMLEALGSDLDHLVRAIDYTTPATRSIYSKVGRPRRELLTAPFPGAAGILMSDFGDPEILVTMDAIAVPNDLDLVPVNPGWKRYDTLTYGPGLLVGKTLYMSGFGSFDPIEQVDLHDGDPGAQAEYVYSSILEVIQAAGGTAADLVSATEFVVARDRDQYAAIAAGRRRVIGDVEPDITVVPCAALLHDAFSLEVCPIAVLA